MGCIFHDKSEPRTIMNRDWLINAIPVEECVSANIEVSPGDIERVWRTLMSHLCSRHRINARNGRPTDWDIEDLRADRYGGFTNAEYFRSLIHELSRQRREVNFENGIIRLTEYGLDNCKKYDPTFQRDF
jgi:hypothetical protein